jgi:hypothetical protein
MKIQKQKIHELLWRNQQTQSEIINAILEFNITRGNALYWWWSDFTGAWYRNAQNAWNEIASLKSNPPFYNTPFTSAKVLTMALIHHPGFELPYQDLHSENYQIRYADINTFGDGLENFAVWYPDMYAEILSCIYNPNYDVVPHENIHTFFDMAFQVIMLGKIKHYKK